MSRRSAPRRLRIAAFALLLAGLPILAAFTAAGLAPLPDALPPDAHAFVRPRVLTREGVILNRSYVQPWNTHDRVALHDVPPLLRAAFIHAEDGAFHSHRGVDWLARAAAALANLRAGRVVRGASTISEQSVRMIWPRPRSVWSRWLEGFDAARLERRFGKHAVLEFYLNQVPYAANRRGVSQAARHYFDRDLDTLSSAEMLTLAVLVRAPSRLDPWHDPAAAVPAVQRLAARLRASGHLHGEAIAPAPPALTRPALELRAPQLLRRVLAHAPPGAARLVTTVDADTQRTAQAILQERVRTLAPDGVRHAALLVADHRDGSIRAWAVASAPGVAATRLDAVSTARQPGSTLKPFVYALALEAGWSAATMIDDAPFAQSVGNGQHAYRNYSRVHHGAVSVREALGNSLNVPAVKALAFVGAGTLLERLQRLGMRSLHRHADVYGDGLALGNGEVSLHELVEAYAALANGGAWRPLRLLETQPIAAQRQVLDRGASTIIADILADADARTLEFGSAGVLSLPIPTAVKTGTSSDHHDAWAIGFDHRHVVGVWMGSLERRAMHRVSGASGPALVMRGVFARLNRDGGGAPLPRHVALERRSVCADDGDAPRADCRRTREEWFLPARTPLPPASASAAPGVRIRQPASGLMLALDPRLPPAAQRLRFSLAPTAQVARVDWFVDGAQVAQSAGHDWLWPLVRGAHTVRAVVHRADGRPGQHTPAVRFQVQ